MEKSAETEPLKETVSYADLSGSGKDWVDDIVPYVHRELGICAILSCVMVCLPIALLWLKPELEQADTWFQRSGSIIVAIALLVEIRLNRLDETAIKYGYDFLYPHMYMRQKYGPFVSLATYSTYGFVALGTLVWGYGDVLYRAAFS